MRRMVVRLTERQAAALRALAARRGEPVAALLRDGVNRILAEDPQGERLARLRAITGRYRGPGDLGKRHDDYLAEAYATGASESCAAAGSARP